MACQVSGFRFAMARAETGVVSMMHEETNLRLQLGEGELSITDTCESQSLRLNEQFSIMVDYGNLSALLRYIENGDQKGQCVVVDPAAILSEDLLC